MHPRNVVALLITVISLFMLIPGLYQPILHMTADARVISQVAELQAPVLNKSRSILGTAQDLFTTNNQIAAVLIVLFCIIIPVLKSALLLTAIVYRRWTRVIALILDYIGKWSMADVFLVAILLTWLATSEQNENVSQNLTILGMTIPIDVGLYIKTEFGSGFWWFLGYCLLSLAAIQLADLRQKTSQA
ncbi:MAG: paraquat-inducible protein A [Oligoflexus sp.]